MRQRGVDVAYLLMTACTRLHRMFRIVACGYRLQRVSGGAIRPFVKLLWTLVEVLCLIIGPGQCSRKRVQQLKNT